LHHDLELYPYHTLGAIRTTIDPGITKEIDGLKISLFPRELASILLFTTTSYPKQKLFYCDCIFKDRKVQFITK